jgi:hypothetical protein
MSQKSGNLCSFYYQLTCGMIADELEMNKETFRKILVEDLGMRKSAAKLVLQNLVEQKGICLTLCMVFVNNFKNSFLSCCHW